MKLKDYRETPDEGMFEKIHQRLTVRRAMRLGGVAAAVVAVVAVAVVAVSVFVLQDKHDHVEPTGMDELAAVLQDTVAVTDIQVAVATQASEQTVPATQVMHASTASEVAEPAPTEEDLSFLAALLPQGTPVVATLNESEAEGYPDYTHNMPVYLGKVTPDDTTSPIVVINTPKADKAGQQQVHFDNVIWAPNLIVPDGDVDENRVFSIKSTSTLTNFKLHIYNRNGRRIFLTTDPAFTWDATMDGVRVPQGAYVWVATFRDSDGNPRQEQGTVTVIR